MSSSVKLGGERLGSGKKNKYITKTFERSTHNLSYLWRSSMASGTLVPFMSEVGLPGDTFDIELNVDVKTLPTIGPLFGSYKVQLDMFEVPIRLFNGKLHMNKLELGREMNQVFLPEIKMEHDFETENILDDNSQINASCIFSYLGIRGLGRTKNGSEETISRTFNAVPYLGYWSIFKNYYANKQEENAYVIHTTNGSTAIQASKIRLNQTTLSSQSSITISQATTISTLIYEYDASNFGDIDSQKAKIKYASGTDSITTVLARDLFADYHYENDVSTGKRLLVFSEFTGIVQEDLLDDTKWQIDTYTQTADLENTSSLIELTEFPLENIDEMTMDILADVRGTAPFTIDENTRAPYGLSLKKENNIYAKTATQEGLALKTYQSDKFNNWIDTEWIDGTGGVSEVTAVDTTGGSFTIDALSLANKVYKMLNRINMSGGSYDDWLNAVYSHDSVKKTESPVYHGSLIKELSFEEVISTAQTDTETKGDLGDLAGRGRLTGKHKGGKMVIKCHEPCYIMGIASLTPRIDYSQGNKWDVNLKTLDDLHKPDLDQIGFQDLITDEMAWFDTEIDTDSNDKVDYKSVGKVPAWLNYMTAVNQVRGNFAEQYKEMFMTLNRKYEGSTSGTVGIKDITTYIDPAKYNHIFADTSLDSQNFWTQISVKNTARRKMSAKVIPNL